MPGGNTAVRLLIDVMPDRAEANALLRADAPDDARREARTNPDGDAISSSRRIAHAGTANRSQRVYEQIEQALHALVRPSTYAVQAAIAALHMRAPRYGHGNLAEHGPLALLLIGFVEAFGYRAPIVNGLGVILLVARLLNAWGLNSSLKQTFGRQSGAGLTVLVTAGAALLILYAAVPH